VATYVIIASVAATPQIEPESHTGYDEVAW
jgi:hypothetical protein